MKSYILSGAAVLMAAACQSPASTDADMADAEPDPRQGEEVSQICFNGQIRNWRELDRKSVIVEKNHNTEYKLELIGTCDPTQAFTTVGLVTRGASSCLSRGDRLITDEDFGGSCSIRRIYEWNEDAGQEDTDENS